MIADTREHTRSGGRVWWDIRGVPFQNTTYVVAPLEYSLNRLILVKFVTIHFERNIKLTQLKHILLFFMNPIPSKWKINLKLMYIFSISILYILKKYFL